MLGASNVPISMAVTCQECNEYHADVPFGTKSIVCRNCRTQVAIGQIETFQMLNYQVRAFEQASSQPQNENESNEEDLRLEGNKSHDMGPSYVMKPIEVQLVRMELVNSLNEADLEAGFVFGAFTLFAGLTLEQWLGSSSQSGLGVLVLITVIVGGYLVLQRDFTFPTELNVAYDERDKLPRGDVGNN